MDEMKFARSISKLATSKNGSILSDQQDHEQQFLNSMHRLQAPRQEGRDDGDFQEVSATPAPYLSPIPSASSIPYNFSDDSCALEERYNTVSNLLSKAKRALKAGAGTPIFRNNLARKMNTLNGTPYSEREQQITSQIEDEMKSLVLDTWTEEILKFLVLKTITNDNLEPCQLLPGYAVSVGWKTLMLTPSLYSKACISMGNSDIFDHDPSDTATNRLQEKHKVKRHNATLRAYENYFESQPPNLYWNFHAKKVKDEERFLPSMIRQCGVDISLLFHPFSMQQQNTKEAGMSPSMPPNN
eukprot:scaffold5876_cov363-Chaetoceros_neogracile.AAC.5